MSRSELSMKAMPLRHRLFEFFYKWGMLLTVVALIAAFGLASDSFLEPTNIINILRSIAIVTVIAVGVSISLTIGGFWINRIAGKLAGDFDVRLVRLWLNGSDCAHVTSLYVGWAV